MYISRNRRRGDNEAPQNRSVQKAPAPPTDQAPPMRKTTTPPTDQAPPMRKAPAPPTDQAPPMQKAPAPPTDQTPPMRKTTTPLRQPVSPKQSNTPSKQTGKGYIVVRVTTASGAIPLEDATVTVRAYGGTDDTDIIIAHKTDLSGLTPRIELDAPSRTLTQTPGNSKGYTTYNIQVEKEGYNKQFYINVPVFDGVTAVQSADLVPLPENGETDREDPYGSGIYYETENPNLENGSQDA